ncbi:hypothetical protein [Flavobacterium anhuiense]|uniref:hypothetical protein n=1 Tax=Flavobacterium anhuiense TaxID=459526 RepID=UPI003D963E78
MILPQKLKGGKSIKTALAFRGTFGGNSNDSLPEQEADKILYQAIEKSDDIILKTDEKDILIYL